MNKPAPRRLTIFDPAPPGFTHIVLAKRHLLAGPLALLLPDLTPLSAILPDYAQRMQGILITPGLNLNLCVIGSQLWQVSLPPALDASHLALIDGWLESLDAHDRAHQQIHVTQVRYERLARELAFTRADYNDITVRLVEQVDDLVNAQNQLSNANLQLESRVASRTADLANANAHLSQALKELQQTQGELVRSAQLAALGSMVAGIAHELNTPIGNALTVATTLHHEAMQLNRMLQEGTLKRSSLDRYASSTQKVTQVMEKNLHRAANIIGHFKQLAVDQVSENRRQFQLSEIISDTLTALNPKLAKTTHQLHLQLDDKLTMDSFPGAISQVLTNFILNALLHAFEDRVEGQMRLETRTPKETPDTIELIFSDNGSGISAANLQRVFDPFFTTKLGQGGSGLGMHITWHLVTATLGGKIILNSTPNQGTHINVLIPRCAPEPETAPT